MAYPTTSVFIPDRVFRMRVLGRETENKEREAILAKYPDILRCTSYAQSPQGCRRLRSIFYQWHSTRDKSVANAQARALTNAMTDAAALIRLNNGYFAELHKSDAYRIVAKTCNDLHLSMTERGIVFWAICTVAEFTKTLTFYPTEKGQIMAWGKVTDQTHQWLTQEFPLNVGPFYKYETNLERVDGGLQKTIDALFADTAGGALTVERACNAIRTYFQLHVKDLMDNALAKSICVQICGCLMVREATFKLGDRGKIRNLIEVICIRSIIDATDWAWEVALKNRGCSARSGGLTYTLQYYGDNASNAFHDDALMALAILREVFRDPPAKTKAPDEMFGDILDCGAKIRLYANKK